MTWTVCNKRCEAMDDHGYRITWARDPWGKPYFNAFSPSGKHIDSGRDREVLKAQCTIHREKTEQRRIGAERVAS
jgi:hypothetical protein